MSGRGLRVRTHVAIVAALVVASAASGALVDHLRKRDHMDGRPAIAGVVLGPFRALAVDYLWLRAWALESEGHFWELTPSYALIADLQPNLIDAWQLLSHNLVFNLPVAWDSPTVRWTCVREGLTLLEEGLAHNPHADDLADQMLADIRLKGRVYSTRLPEWVGGRAGSPPPDVSALVQQVDAQAARVRERYGALPQWVRDEVFYHLDCRQMEPFILADRYAGPDDPGAAFTVAVRDGLAWSWIQQAYDRQQANPGAPVDPIARYFPAMLAIQARIDGLGVTTLVPDDQPDAATREGVESILAARQTLIDALVDAFPFDRLATDGLPAHDPRRYADSGQLSTERIAEFRGFGANRWGLREPGLLQAWRDTLRGDLRALEVQFVHDAVQSDVPAIDRLLTRRRDQIAQLDELERRLARVDEAARVARERGDAGESERQEAALRHAIAEWARDHLAAERAFASGLRLAVDACSIAGVQWGLRDAAANPRRGAFALLAALAPALDALTSTEDPALAATLEPVGQFLFARLDAVPDAQRVPTRTYERDRRRRWADAIAQRPERK